MKYVVFKLLWIVAGACAGYSVATWALGLPKDAGISAAVSASLIVVAELVAYCDRIRQGRVWERREMRR